MTCYFTTLISEQALCKHQRSSSRLTVQGVVGTSSGTVWYINWPEKSSVKLVSGHTKEVSTPIRITCENGSYVCVAIVTYLQVCGVAFSQGGTHFASCSQEGSLAVVSMETMEQLVLLQAPKKVDM